MRPAGDWTSETGKMFCSRAGGDLGEEDLEETGI